MGLQISVGAFSMAGVKASPIRGSGKPSWLQLGLGKSYRMLQ